MQICHKAAKKYNTYIFWVLPQRGIFQYSLYPVQLFWSVKQHEHGDQGKQKRHRRERAAVRIRQAEYVGIEEYQLGMGNVTQKPGSVAKEIIFLAVEKKP